MATESGYFDIQADMGITKHMGGRIATKQLVRLAGIKKGDKVLEIGSGVGRTACFLAKVYEVKVDSIDISPKMVKRSLARASKMGLSDQVNFICADAQKLPFEDGSFDLIISESVTAFIPDKKQALSEYQRVLKPKGVVAINEVTWKATPDPKMVAYTKLVMGGPTFYTQKEWEKLLISSGFENVTSQIQQFNVKEQLIGELQQFNLLEYLHSLARFSIQMLINVKYWRFMITVLSQPKQLFTFTKKIEQGFYIAKKTDNF